MSIFKARVEYEVTDASVKTYSFPFPYLRKEFIKVSILHTDNSVTALTYGVDYSVDDLTITLVTAPSVSEHLIIYRETTTDKIITWNDGSILLAKDMNTEDAQMLHLQEEQKDYLLANALATSVTGNKETIWSAQNHRITDVSDPKEPQDAVTQHYMENVQGGFVSANTALVQEATKQVSAAKASQESAKASATQADESERASLASANLAEAWATSTTSPDNIADAESATGKTQSSRSWSMFSKSKAQEAATSATNAKTQAETATTQATNAKTSASQSASSASASATSASNAKTSETNAKTSETQAGTSANAAKVSETNAAESARIATEYGGDFNMLKRNKPYSVGDIAYSPSLPSWARLECVTAGTTGASTPSSLTTVSSGGILISDGTVTWIVDDIRDMTPVGCVRGSLFLPKGYIKANGATVQRADYPRLVHFIESNNLWTDDTTNNVGLFGKGNGSSTFVLPDYRERMMQYTDDSIGEKRNAGLPNITGTLRFMIWRNEEINIAGCFRTDTPPAYAQSPRGGADMGGITASLDASRSHNIYGSSSTVQPPAINVIPILRY